MYVLFWRLSWFKWNMISNVWLTLVGAGIAWRTRAFKLLGLKTKNFFGTTKRHLFRQWTPPQKKGFVWVCGFVHVIEKTVWYKFVYRALRLRPLSQIGLREYWFVCRFCKFNFCRIHKLFTEYLAFRKENYYFSWKINN